MAIWKINTEKIFFSLNSQPTKIPKTKKKYKKNIYRSNKPSKVKIDLISENQPIKIKIDLIGQNNPFKVKIDLKGQEKAY